jgi:hypothetical protein
MQFGITALCLAASFGYAPIVSLILADTRVNAIQAAKELCDDMRAEGCVVVSVSGVLTCEVDVLLWPGSQSFFSAG